MAPESAVNLPLDTGTAASSTVPKGAGYLRHSLILGSVNLMGAVSMNVYIPAMPAIGKDLGASPQAVQMTIVAYMAAIAIAQLFYGPVSDRFGRKLPLGFGLVLFSIGSAGAALAQSMEILFLCRMLQGFGASAGFVIPRAIIRDLHTGWEAARLLAMMMLITSIGPTVAPVLGSLVLAHFPWNAVFWILSALAVAPLILTVWLLPESLPAARRQKHGGRDVLATYRQIFTDRRFMLLASSGAIVQAGPMAYLASSSFLFTDLYGLTPMQYALVQAGTSIAWIGGVQVSPFIMRATGARGLIFAGLGIALAGSVILLALVLTGQPALAAILCVLGLIFAGTGLILSPALVTAMHGFDRNAGSAAAVAGALQFAFSALTSASAAALYRGTFVPVALVMAVCVIVSLVMTLMAKIPTAREEAEQPASP